MLARPQNESPLLLLINLLYSLYYYYTESMKIIPARILLPVPFHFIRLGEKLFTPSDGTT